MKSERLKPGIQYVRCDLLDITVARSVRVEVNYNLIREYQQAVERGDTFHPVVVFVSDEGRHLADGLARVTAHTYAVRAAEEAIAQGNLSAEEVQAKRQKIKDWSSVLADIREGTRRDAWLYAVGANSRNGARPTRDDLRLIITGLLTDAEFVQRADRWIAQMVGCDHKTAVSVRLELEKTRRIQRLEKLLGQDGKWRPRTTVVTKVLHPSQIATGEFPQLQSGQDSKLAGPLVEAEEPYPDVILEVAEIDDEELDEEELDEDEEEKLAIQAEANGVRIEPKPAPIRPSATSAASPPKPAPDSAPKPTPSEPARPKSTPTPPAPRDATGRILPEWLRDAFGDPMLGEVASELNDMVLTTDRLHNRIRNKIQHFPFVVVEATLNAFATARTALATLHANIEAGIPHAVCPSCNGKQGGCKDCRRGGLVPAWRYEELGGGA